MPNQAPSATLRTQLRTKILKRIDELKFEDIEVADELGLSPGLASNVRSDG